MSDSTTPRVTCYVKWFNTKNGYGFVTTCKGYGEKDEVTDVFVHHSALTTGAEIFKYLVQGEYVDLDVVTTDSQEHPIQASNVTGVFGGRLMCETIDEKRKAQEEYERNNATASGGEGGSAEADSTTGGGGGGGGRGGRGGKRGRGGGRGGGRGRGGRRPRNHHSDSAAETDSTSGGDGKWIPVKKN